MAPKLIHEVIRVGMLQCNCSILGDPATGDAIVVDPGDEVERILEIVHRRGLTVRTIVSTHTHIDHVGGLAGLHRATGAPVLIHEADLELYENLETQAGWLGVPTPAVMPIRDFVPGGSFPQILASIREKLLTLPDELVVYPGHGDTTTIGSEREFNPFLR
jgi:hydroxyacylglutathione hydrolase